MASFLAFGSGQAPAASPDPAAEAARLIAKLSASSAGNVVRDPLLKAKAARTRAQNARSAGDLPHATELDTLALTWALVAEDLERTATSERKLAELQKAVSELEQKSARTQALIEQTIARRGRAEQNLQAASKAPPSAGPSPTRGSSSSPAAKPTSAAGKP